MGYFADFRSWLTALEEVGLLRRVKSEVLIETEAAPLAWLVYRGLPADQRCALLVERPVSVRGSTFEGSLVMNSVAASRRMYALGMQCGVEEIKRRWLDAIEHPVPPVLVPSGPCQEEVHMGAELAACGLDELPVPVDIPGLSGDPRTTTAVITKDPETGQRNVGVYSGFLKTRTILRWGIGVRQHGFLHWRKWRDRGEPMPVAIAIGCTPNILYAASTKLPEGLDELAVAGGIAREPVALVRCRTIDLEVPANAEIIIEGLMETDYLYPGTSFGEYPGFMADETRRYSPILRITAITHRHRPIFQHVICGMPPSETSELIKYGHEASLLHHLRQAGFEGVVDVGLPDFGGSREFIVLQMQKRSADEPRAALRVAAQFSGEGMGKILVAVDEDIDPCDAEAVCWAMTFRMQPAYDVEINKGPFIALDPSGHPPSGTFEEGHLPEGPSSILIDATRKWPYMPIALPKKSFMERALQIWEMEGLPALHLRSLWYSRNLGYWSDENELNAQLTLKGQYEKIWERAEQKKVPVEKVGEHLGL
jgi:4-hydroxy-3-polyprenylbenzoate decarboxylase